MRTVNDLKEWLKQFEGDREVYAEVSNTKLYAIIVYDEYKGKTYRFYVDYPKDDIVKKKE